MSGGHTRGEGPTCWRPNAKYSWRPFTMGTRPYGAMPASDSGTGPSRPARLVDHVRQEHGRRGEQRHAEPSE